MTTLDTLRPAGNARIGGFFAPFINTLISWNDTRVTRNALSRLSDRELDDIGLSRGDIERLSA